MRKLLVASQKGGVGKTTTSINLAGAIALAGARVLLLDADPFSPVSAALSLSSSARRQALQTIGLDLPGVLIADLLGGLDVLSPYEDGMCSDKALDRLLEVLAAPALAESYSCLIVDAPPFLGANPAQLVSACEELLLVMRAEPLAARTLPAFLELLQRSRKERPALRLHGILLTLSEGEGADGKCEQELRGRYGTRILPQVIPHEEQVAQLREQGRILVDAAPDSPVALQYHRLAEHLRLAVAEAALQQTRRTLAEILARATSRADTLAPVSLPPGSPFHPVFAEPRSRKRDSGRQRRSDRAAATPASTAAGESRSALDGGAPMLGSLRTQLGMRVIRPVRQPAVSTPTSPPWIVWVLLGVLVGSAARFIHLPGTLVPLIVGFGASAGVVIWLRFLGVPSPTPAAVPIVSSGRDKRGASQPSPRPPVKRDASARLQALMARHPRTQK